MRFFLLHRDFQRRSEFCSLCRRIIAMSSIRSNEAPQNAIVSHRTKDFNNFRRHTSSNLLIALTKAMATGNFEFGDKLSYTHVILTGVNRSARSMRLVLFCMHYAPYY